MTIGLDSLIRALWHVMKFRITTVKSIQVPEYGSATWIFNSFVLELGMFPEIFPFSPLSRTIGRE
jgi:hypothetical protein